MDGFSLLAGCGPKNNYPCYTQYDPSQIPNLISIATQFGPNDPT